MGTQRETIKIARPFKQFLVSRGWHCENVHSNQYSSLPFDCIAWHQKYRMRCIEFKVIEDSGSIKFSDVQKKKFPIVSAHGGEIWVVAGRDFRGASGLAQMQQAYKLLFAEANFMVMLNPQMRRLMYPSLFKAIKG